MADIKDRKHNEVEESITLNIILIATIVTILFVVLMISLKKNIEEERVIKYNEIKKESSLTP